MCPHYADKHLILLTTIDIAITSRLDKYIVVHNDSNSQDVTVKEKFTHSDVLHSTCEIYLCYLWIILIALGIILHNILLYFYTLTDVLVDNTILKEYITLTEVFITIVFFKQYVVSMCMRVWMWACYPLYKLFNILN